MKEEKSGFFGKHISMLNRFEQMFYEKRLEKYGIGGGQQFVLWVIWNHPGISQFELAQRIRIDKGTIAKAVKKLVLREYVVRKNCKKDRRMNQLFATSSAQPVIEETVSAWKDWRGIITSGMTDEELVIVEKFICLMAENAWKYTVQDGKK